jgi:chemotaxis protein CheY-P-specific phosphatase CheC
MTELKRFNKILEAVVATMQQEVGALLGADFVLAKHSAEIVGKAEAFEPLKGKQVCAKIEISGEESGAGCLLVGIKDAIRLGGTLIMLPAAELEEVSGREEYSEELADSYGEIANIVAGAFTRDFEELYPKTCRFVRKDQEVIVPLKVDTDSEHPVPDQRYLRMAVAMNLEGRQLGEMVMLLPSAVFALEKQSEASASAAQAPPGAQPNQPTEPVAVAPKEENAATSQVPPVAHLVKPGVDPVKQKKKINRLLEECSVRLGAEIGGLLSVDVSFTDLEHNLLTKGDFFSDHAAGRQVLTNMAVVGDEEDTAYLALGIKDAIALGGVLIMLPPAELENVVNAQEFSEDARDAYGEVANIISGVYSAVFEEQYTRKLRFIRKEMQEVVPAKVAVDSADPLPDQLYYVSAMTLNLQGRQLGRLQMLFPAELVELGLAPAPEPHSAQAAAAPAEPVSTIASPAQGGAAARPVVSGPSREEQLKRKKRFDALLENCRGKMEEEVGALLGTEVSLSNPENVLIGKEAFFDEKVSGKQVFAALDILGDLSGQGHLVIGLGDAIRIGGMLIMLPSQELDAVVAREEFGEDTRDAYGEIANIAAGAYTAVFEEQYGQRIRFVKTGLTEIIPAKVVVEGAEPFPDQDHYLSMMDLSIGGSALGRVSLLLPAALFGLDGLNQAAAVQQETEPAVSGAGSTAGAPGFPATGTADPPVDPDILLVGDDFIEAARITAVLEELGYRVRTLSFKDSLQGLIPGRLKAIYLVMREVNEQVFGVAIRISTASSLPLIAAGPAWTKGKVIKAVRYGVSDILLTPASREDIAENVRNNLLQKAA